MWIFWQNVYSQIKQISVNPLSRYKWQPPPLHPFSYQPPDLRRWLLVFPVCTIIIDEGSLVITSRQFGIDSCLQCVFQCLVHGPFLESIMLFSRWKDSSWLTQSIPSQGQIFWTSTELYSFEQNKALDSANLDIDRDLFFPTRHLTNLKIDRVLFFRIRNLINS